MDSTEIISYISVPAMILAVIALLYLTYPIILDEIGIDNHPPEKKNITEVPPEFEISSGWTITSYQNLDEQFYEGEKMEVFDREGNSLGMYKLDFLVQTKIDGSGKGDGIQNPGSYIHYDFEVDDGVTYYLIDRSVGAYSNELIPWTGKNPSVAVNPPLPQGTEIMFIDLGEDSRKTPHWVNTILLTKVFYADDKFYGVPEGEKKIDIYVGTQTSKTPGPETLLLRNVTIGIKR